LRERDAGGERSADTCDRLELLGDAALNLVVTTLLRELYPHLRVGPSTVCRLDRGTRFSIHRARQKTRANVVENVTLAAM
jgi:hypothetical protein